jgi:spermidine synthase
MTSLEKIRYNLLYYWYRLRYPPKVLYEVTSDTYTIQVTQEGAKRRLIFNGHGYSGIQGEYDLLAPYYLTKEYARLMTAGLLFPIMPKMVLVAGLGGGSIPRFLAHHYPESTIDVIEKDEHVIDIAKRYFDMKPSEKFRIICADATETGVISATYDLILLDCFYEGPKTPDGMRSKDYYRFLQDRLAENGVVVINFHQHDSNFSENIQIFESSFPSVLSLRGEIPCQIMIGGNNLCQDIDQLDKLARKIQQERRFSYKFPQVVKAIVSNRR